jgi:hypothetical protein
VPVRYLQLVHNVWDPAARTTKAKVLDSAGTSWTVRGSSG